MSLNQASGAVRKGARSPLCRQRGVVLVVALLMLLAFTLLSLSMTEFAGKHFKVVYNQQIREEMERAGLEGIELVLNSQNAFNVAATGIGSHVAPISTPTTINGYRVSVTPPTCYGAGNLQYSALSSVAAEEASWQLTATVNDARTSATIQVWQAVRVRMPGGSCR